MTNSKADAISPIRKVRVCIKGVGGTLNLAYKATLKSTILDDEGVPRDLIIPNGYIVEQLPIRFLSPPTHIIPPDEDLQPTTTNHKTPKATPEDNDNFLTAGPQPQPSTTPIHIIPDQCQVIPPETDDDNENEGDINNKGTTSARQTNEGDRSTNEGEVERLSTKAKRLTIDKDTPLFEEQKYSKIESVKQEMMFWHLGLGHLLHKRMMAMAKAGDIPRRFMQDPMPECAACCFCKAMKVPWRTKVDMIKGKSVPLPNLANAYL
eukprot:CAMPEP_0178930064 /NCGR_PEP_ID=MMETSP0786-20121207/21003_1 /TAXON_ID=186022 /ORGANISM="Thalassionema frauenfeldii, Strain CCMP 1798" /LENGTH=263 /DNA_ID=CAMNT_0020606501 /DNA_START=1185 /DNA_END=1975 /DNA_ORIENTATION=+